MTDKDRILIIDDDILLARLVNLYLTRAGFEVFVAHSGREGLQEVGQLRPDLIVLDIMMPEMDGWEVCSRIRQIDDLPIIMLTARGQEFGQGPWAQDGRQRLHAQAVQPARVGGAHRRGLARLAAVFVIHRPLAPRG